MDTISFFKLQAKNLFRDYKTQKPYVDAIDGETYYEYAPKYFDIDRIFLEYDWDEENFSLMKAQHLMANMVGFQKWSELINASEKELELTKLVFDNQHKIFIEEWEMYIAEVEMNNDIKLDAEGKIEIFKNVFANVDGHHSPFGDYRINTRTP